MTRDVILNAVKDLYPKRATAFEILRELRMTVGAQNGWTSDWSTTTAGSA